MKKFILLFLILFLTVNSCLADELRLDKEIQYQKKIMAVGFRILNANETDKRITFCYDNNKEPEAYSLRSSKKVCISKGLFTFIESDDELAALLSHEIGRQIEYYNGFIRRTGIFFKPKKYESKADVKAVDLMVNAGYNPVALIIILNKITSEPSFTDDWGFRRYIVGSKRLMGIYEYIYTKYPAYLVDNEFKNNLYYQNFLLVSKKQRAIIRKKYQSLYTQNVSDKK